MEEVKETEKEEVSKDNKEEKVSNFGITLLVTVLGVAIGFAVLLCMQ